MEERRGPTIRVGDGSVVPIAKTWSVGITGSGWSAGASYSAPILEVADADGMTETRTIPDFDLWIRVAAMLAVVAAVLSLGGRR